MLSPREELRQLLLSRSILNMINAMNTIRTARTASSTGAGERTPLLVHAALTRRATAMMETGSAVTPMITLPSALPLKPLAISDNVIECQLLL